MPHPPYAAVRCALGALALMALGCGAPAETSSSLTSKSTGSGSGAGSTTTAAASGAGGSSGATSSATGSGAGTTSGTTSGAGGATGGGGSAPAPQIIYVNFDGATITDCPEPCSDAPNDQSWAISAHFGQSVMTFDPYTDETGKPIIVANLTSAYAPYNVAITTARPASGPYTMVIISPTTGAHHGVAPLDCMNANPNDIAFVYNIYSSSYWSTPQQIARSAAHELGHSFGLTHVVSTSDFMEWASSGNAFTVSTYDYDHPGGHDCLTTDTQDAPAMLLEALGPAPQ